MLEVFPVLGSGVARARPTPTGSSGTAVPAMRPSCARRTMLDRASENGALARTDEWFESVQACVGAIKRHRGWLGVSDPSECRPRRALDPPPVVNARFAAVAGAPAGRAAFLLDSELAATANIAATLSCKPVLQTFWGRPTRARGSRSRRSLRGVAPYHIRERRARGAASSTTCPRTWSRSSTTRAARAAARGRRRVATTPATRAAARGVVVVDAQPRRRRRRGGARAVGAEQPAARDLSEEAFTLPAALDEMLAELGSTCAAQRRDVPADERRARRHGRARVGARAQHPDAFAARAPRRSRSAPGSRGTRCRSSRTSLTTTSAPRTCGRRRRCSRV